MNLFRHKTLYRLIESTESWQYPVKEAKRPGRKMGGNRDGSQAMLEEGSMY